MKDDGLAFSCENQFATAGPLEVTRVRGRRVRFFSATTELTFAAIAPAALATTGAAATATRATATRATAFSAFLDATAPFLLLFSGATRGWAFAGVAFLGAGLAALVATAFAGFEGFEERAFAAFAFAGFAAFALGGLAFAGFPGLAFAAVFADFAGAGFFFTAARFG